MPLALKLDHFSSSLLTHCISGGRRSTALCKQGAKSQLLCQKHLSLSPQSDHLSTSDELLESFPGCSSPSLPSHPYPQFSPLWWVFSSILLFSDSAQFCHFHCMNYSHPCLAPASPVFLMCPTPFLAVVPWFWP